MIEAVLSIGANLGNARENLQSVFDAFADCTTAKSKVYSTPPWGGVEQGDFFNAVLIIRTEHSPLEVLRAGQALENAAGRVRKVHWGPRTLDVDVVSVRQLPQGTELVSTDATLTLPHPWAHERAFVLVPWLDADPNAVLNGQPVAQLVAKLEPQEVADVKVATP